MKSDLRSLLILYLAVFLLSLNGLFAKLIPLDALTITQLRSCVALIAFVAFARLGRRSLRLSGRRRYEVMGLGVLLGLHWVTFFHAMQIATVAIGMVALFTFPIMTILLEPLFSAGKLQRGDVIAGVVVLSGVAVMVCRDLHDPGGSVVQGVIFGVVSALLFSLRNLLQKYRYADVPSDCLMFYQVIAIGLMLLPFIDTSAVAAMQMPDWGILLLQGILSTATAHSLLTWSLKLRPAGSVALIGCLQPPVAALLALLVIGEVPQWPVIVGGAMILAVAAYESS